MSGELPSMAPLNALLGQNKQLRMDFSRFMLNYEFAIDEVMTKINILRKEFEHLHDYSPLEHITSRLKSPERLVEKLQRLGIDFNFESVQENILDVAGIRVVCSFNADVYSVAEMLAGQADLEVLNVKDYIKNPKANGYRSLHMIVRVPVFLSASVEHMCVELQLRTVAMDFWASLEHKIYYKYQTEIPAPLLQELVEAAETAHQLDVSMERIHEVVRGRHPQAGHVDAPSPQGADL